MIIMDTENRQYYLDIIVDALKKQMNGLQLIGGPVAEEQVEVRRKTIEYLRKNLK